MPASLGAAALGLAASRDWFSPLCARTASLVETGDAARFCQLFVKCKVFAPDCLASGRAGI